MTVESFDKYLGEDSQTKLNQVLNRDTFTWSWSILEEVSCFRRLQSKKIRYSMKKTRQDICVNCCLRATICTLKVSYIVILSLRI